MRPEDISKLKAFTGFIAYYDNGKVIKERESFFSKILNKNCATNWAELDKSKLIALELHWNNELKVRIDKNPHPDNFNKTTIITPERWLFSQKGYLDISSKKIVVIARCIGFIEDGIANITSVAEDTGIISIIRKAA